jgi:hypothetical protein
VILYSPVCLNGVVVILTLIRFKFFAVAINNMLHGLKMTLVLKLLNNADLRAYSTLQNCTCDVNMTGGRQ